MRRWKNASFFGLYETTPDGSESNVSRQVTCKSPRGDDRPAQVEGPVTLPDKGARRITVDRRWINPLAPPAG